MTAIAIDAATSSEPQDHSPPTEPDAVPAAAGPRKPRGPHPVLQRLFELHPKMFGARFLPLKLGAFEDLMALHPGEFKKDELKVALGLHTRSTRYLESVAQGRKRHDLDGNPVEDLAPEHVHHAIAEVYKRRQGKSKDDLRPWLRERLLRAVQASGLNREDYTARVRSNDEAVNAALDEVFAQLGAQAARNEALRRAFAASGKAVEEFADMYGMPVAQVRRALAADQPPVATATA